MSQDRSYWVYVLASEIGGTLYIGVTNNLVRRVYEHRTDATKGFSQQYGVHRLVYFEQFDQIEFAIQREAAQEMEAHVEDRADRKDKPTVGGPVSKYGQPIRSLGRWLLDRPVKPGDDKSRGSRS